jgi:dCMP deaminase
MNSRVLEAIVKSAAVYGKLSYAKTKQVVAVIIKGNRILAIGYNGTPEGYDNICEDEVNGELITRPYVLHAEENAIAFAAKNGIATDGCSVYVTFGPCVPCSRIMIQAGIKKVYYRYEANIKHSAAIPFLLDNGVEVVKVEF